MAIKPQNRSRYGPDWRKFSRALVRERGNRCEICSKPRYRVPWLTVHHKDRTPENRTPDNLIVCCPRCHFRQEYEINRRSKLGAQYSIQFPDHYTTRQITTTTTCNLQHHP